MDIYYQTKSTYNSINLSDLGPSEMIKSKKKETKKVVLKCYCQFPCCC